MLAGKRFPNHRTAASNYLPTRCSCLSSNYNPCLDQHRQMRLSMEAASPARGPFDEQVGALLSTPCDIAECPHLAWRPCVSGWRAAGNPPGWSSPLFPGSSYRKARGEGEHRRLAQSIRHVHRRDELAVAFAEPFSAWGGSGGDGRNGFAWEARRQRQALPATGPVARAPSTFVLNPASPAPELTALSNEKRRQLAALVASGMTASLRQGASGAERWMGEGGCLEGGIPRCFFRGRAACPPRAGATR
jgi:hypothetical protein